MKTYILMRHGDYDDKGLTEEGKQQADAAAERAIKENLVPDLIVHSPMPRAAETAQRVRDVFSRVAGRDIPMAVNDNLHYDYYPTSALLAEGLSDGSSLVLAVTHAPNVRILSESFGKACYPGKGEMNVFRSRADSWSAIKKAAFVKTL